MRTIDSIIIHCSATPYGKEFTAADIDRWHRQRGFNGIGYHFVIQLNGTIENGRSIDKPGAHCIGWNNRSIGICYIGGLNTTGHPADTRTPAQRRSLQLLIDRLQSQHVSIRTIIGHRDTSPDLNGNGCVEPNEFIKSCPCFDVRKWMQSLSAGMLCTTLLLFATSCGSHKNSTQQSALSQQTASKQAAETKSTQRNHQESLNQLSDSAHGSEQQEEYLEKTIIIHRKSRNDSNQWQKKEQTRVATKDSLSTQARTALINQWQTTTLKQQEKQSKRTPNTLLWSAGVGIALVFLYRRSRRKPLADA